MSIKKTCTNNAEQVESKGGKLILKTLHSPHTALRIAAPVGETHSHPLTSRLLPSKKLAITFSPKSPIL